ncbi:hypothetical protein [Paenibacillus sp. NPDC057934]|uniref:hypothetical protein n=1 Tax=Paenibacillus sp. NPDC057934 TaxID=3346282 RepID=UPI0036D97AA4
MTFSTGLVKVTETYAPMIERQLSGNGVNLDPYSRQCVINAISAINTVLDSKAISWNDEKLDRNNITQVLMNIAALKLNAAASPREVYFQIRNVNVKAKQSDPDNWRKQIEMGIEGDGNDAILSNFGRNVEKVYPYWLVREEDHFVYPKFRGVEYEPPEWSPTGRGEVVRVVYPILHTDKTLHYYISERDDVVKNLIAHMSNNMMNETFSICADRYKATSDQKKQIAAKKAEVLKRAKDLGIGALDDVDLQQFISPAWSEYQSRESMLIRKMRNNVVKKIPKDFNSAYVEMLHDEVNDPDYAEVRREINENANTELLDVTSASPTQPLKEEVPLSNASESQPSDAKPTGSADPNDFSGDVPPQDSSATTNPNDDVLF